jgi:hypothetical protein
MPSKKFSKISGMPRGSSATGAHSALHKLSDSLPPSSRPRPFIQPPFPFIQPPFPFTQAPFLFIQSPFPFLLPSFPFLQPSFSFIQPPFPFTQHPCPFFQPPFPFMQAPLPFVRAGRIGIQPKSQESRQHPGNAAKILGLTAQTWHLFALSYKDDHGETQFVSLLEPPPVNSPRDAVQIAIASRKQK